MYLVFVATEDLTYSETVMLIRTHLFVASLLVIGSHTPANAQTFNCDIPIPRIKDQMIRESTARYQGRCPCPYFRDSAGRRCGKRSAWSRPGGASPLCYPNDVSAEMVRDFCEVLKLRGAAN